MKKILCILLALMMCVCLVACNNSEDNDAPVVENEVQEVEVNEEVAQYVEEHGKELTSSLEESFNSSSGLTCTASVTVVASGIVIDVNIGGVDGASDAMKQQMQATYDEQQATFDTILTALQTEIPSLESVQFNVNEEDGDLLAKIYAE